MAPLLHVFVLCLLVLSHSLKASAACTPIFHSKLSLLNGSHLTHLDEPITKRDTSSHVCPNIAVDSQTCCSPEADEQITAAAHSLVHFRNSLAEVAPSALLQSLFRHQAWLDLNDSHVQWRNLTDEQQVIVQEYVNIVTPLLTGATPCVDAVLTSIQGLLCLSCEPNAGDFVDDGVLRQHKGACERTSDACVPVIEALVTALPRLLELYIGFLLSVPPPLPPLAAASLSQSYLLRAAMSGGVSATGFCQSAYVGILTGRYEAMHDCSEVVCTLLDRGLDWDVRRWLGLHAPAEDDIQLRKMRHNQGIVIKPGSGGMGGGGGHGGHRRLLSVAPDETDSGERLVTVSSFGSLSSVVSGLYSRFHVMHGGLHGGMDDMKDTHASTTPTMRAFPPAPTGRASAANGRLSSDLGDDARYYPVWWVGCDSLAHFGIICPMNDDRRAAHDKAVFLGAVFVVGLLVSCAMWAAYRAWATSGGGGSEVAEGGDGLLGVNKRVQKIKARLSRRVAQRSRQPAGVDEAEGILAE